MAAASASFKMVVLGDSILWGQGLPAQQKIHTLVTAELVRRGLNVETVFHAHSGAIIGEPDVNTHKPAIDGEVPVGEPTVFEQIETALEGQERDEAVQLLLISAGVNDVDITRIANLRDRGLDGYIEDAFYRKMKLLFERTVHCFPNAVIIFAGYYKPFSDASERGIMLNVLRGLGFGLRVMPNIVGELVIEMLSPRLTAALVERCQRFYDYSCACMHKAMTEFFAILPEAQARLFFADPKFGDEHAVGTPQSLLYGINPDFTPQDPPEVAEARARACVIHADRLSLIERISAPRASVVHPNADGARRYAAAILAQLRYALPALFTDD